MSGKIVELLQVAQKQHDLNWLKQALQAAIELEMATIPPYLCGLWSIKLQAGPVFDLIEGIVLEEMLHMGLVCNMLAGIGGTPEIVSGYRTVKYPGHLPGGVRPNLTVYLGGLTKDYVDSIYMQVEYPESGPLAQAMLQTYPTIGEFYNAVSDAFQNLAPTIKTDKQLVSPGVRLTKLATVSDVLNAIQEIKEQGEGTSTSPEALDFGGELAHYYRFGEIFHGCKFVPVSGGWAYRGDEVPFPEVYPFTPIPAGGYPDPPDSAKHALQAFDQQFAQLLTDLDTAWASGNQDDLGKGIGAMFNLQPLAVALMQIQRTDSAGVYGPDFQLP